MSSLNLNKRDPMEVPTLPNWDPNNWTAKRIHNTPLFRSATILLAIYFAGRTANSTHSKHSMVNISTQTAAIVHVLSFGTFFGSNMYTTFVSGIIMYKNLPRQMFGRLQSKLFPTFFNLCAVSTLLQIITLNKLTKLSSGRSSNALIITLVATLINLFILEPITTKVMFQRYDLEKREGGSAANTPEYKKLASTFGKLHGISSLMNLVALCASVAHGCYLASSIIS